MTSVSVSNLYFCTVGYGRQNGTNHWLVGKMRVGRMGVGEMTLTHFFSYVGSQLESYCYWDDVDWVGAYIYFHTLALQLK